MGRLEDEIKRKLNEGEIEFNPDHWDQLNEKLDAENSYTPFEKKAQDILNSGTIGSAANAWEDMNDHLDRENPSSFDTKAKEILSNENLAYASASWDTMRDKLSNADLTAFEKSSKDILNSQDAPYNPEHWVDMEARLDNKKRRGLVWWSWVGAAAAVSVGVVALLVNNSVNSGNQVETINKKAPASTTVNTKTSINNEIREQKINELNTPNTDATHTVDLTEAIKEGRNNNLPPVTPNRNEVGGSNFHSVSTSDMNPTSDLLPEKKEEEETKEKLHEKLFNTIALDKNYSELCLNLEGINKLPFFYKKPTQSQLHAAATLWLNFWDNPSVTGFYGKHNLSNCFKNAFETVESETSQYGKVDFIQPIQNTAGYERQIGNSGFAVGAYYAYSLKKNWNLNDIAITASYKKEILTQTFVRLGASATFKHEQLAVNRLTLRERTIYGDYIFTSNLGDFEGKSEHYISYDLGGFIDHPYFFAGYSAKNVAQTWTNKSEEDIMVKHQGLAGFHIPVLNNLKASAMIKLDRDLITAYSPAIGLTYKNQYFVVGEYNRLNRFDISAGYNWRQQLRILGTVGVKQLENNVNDLNLDHFNEREGFVSLGVYYTIK